METAERGQLIAGARFIRHSAVVRAVLAATATVNFFNFLFAAVFILYVTRSLHVSPAQLGLVLGLGAGGGVLGAAVASRIGNRIGVGPTFMVGSLLFPAPILLVPLARGSHLVVLSCALTGGALGTAFGLHTAIWVAAIGGLTGVLWLLPSPVFALRTLDIEGHHAEATG